MPGDATRLMLWEEHPDVLGKLDDLFWEEQKVWYKCINERDEGIILTKAKEGEIQVLNGSIKSLPFNLTLTFIVWRQEKDQFGISVSRYW